jgi:putative peptidoglycan lipid II flippase
MSHLAADHAQRDVETIRHTVGRAVAWVMAILVACSVLLYVVRLPLLRLIFLHGQMDEVGVDRMAAILPYHLVGLAPFGALLVLARAHVAMKNGRIMFAIGVFNAICNVVFDLLFYRLIGLEGLALSTSCVHTAVAIIFWFRLQTHLGASDAEHGRSAA